MIRRVRPPVPDDLCEALSALMDRAYGPAGMRAWSAGEIATMAAEPVSILLASLIGDRPAGFLLASVLKDEVEILALAVDPDCKRRGIATDLVDAMANIARGSGATRLILEVAETNSEAAMFYEMLRFEEIARRPNYYRMPDSRVDARLMERRCSSG